MSLQAGLLNERLAFDARQDVNDGYGNKKATWVEQHACAARVQHLRGGESVIASRLAGTQPVVITIRRCIAANAITTDWRARDTRSGVVFNIRTISPSENREFIDLLAEKGVAHG